MKTVIQLFIRLACWPFVLFMFIFACLVCAGEWAYTGKISEFSRETWEDVFTLVKLKKATNPEPEKTNA